MRRSLSAAVLAAFAPAALAFEAVDTIPYTQLGGFPAYPRAEARPGRIYAQAGVRHDDNILRTPTGEENETIFRLGAGASYDARVYGRQIVRLEAQADAFVFENFSNLDHVAYGVLGEWLWEVGNQLSGTLGYGRRRFQIDLSELRSPSEDLATEQRVFGTGAYRFHPDWRVRGAFELADVERPERRVAESESQGASAGIDYVTPLGNSIGVEVRAARGDAAVPEEVDPLGLFVNNDYDEREVAAVLAYNTGPQLRLRGRIARTERTYSEIPGRNFEGTTGRLDVSWRPGNKTILDFEVYRVPRSIIDVAASHVVAEGVAFGPRWAPREKLVFAARILQEHREFAGDPGAALGVTPVRDETVRAFRLAGGWEATRHNLFGLAVEFGERSSNFLGRDYDYTAVMANYRYVF